MDKIKTGLYQLQIQEPSKEIRCEICKKEYTKGYTEQRFCGSPCYQKHRRTLHKKK